MKRVYAIAEVQWVLPDGEHEDWLIYKGRLCRPVRFEKNSDALCELCFALAEAVHHNQTFMLPITTLRQESATLLTEGAIFEVCPDGRRIVAVGRIVSVEITEEQDFRHLFRA